MTAERLQILGYAMEIHATLEQITDRRSQLGRPSVDEPHLLKRCRDLAQELEMILKPSPTWSPDGGAA